mgnify:CR=1 FL=1
MKKQMIFMGLLAALVLSSCSSRKRVVYLQDMIPGEEYPLELKHEAKVQRDDRLAIVVTCKQPALAIPFNMQGGSVSVNANGEVSQSSGVPATKGYRVDINGDWAGNDASDSDGLAPAFRLAD